jgi:signal transduction histidine kinase/CheY-like chemotaxis protein
MRFSRKKRLHPCEDSLRKISFLSEMTLDGLPHPAIVINKHKMILVANRIAGEMGATPGKNCGRDFCANALVSQPRGACRVKREAETSFCLAEEALSFKEVRGRAEARLFDRLWDVWWIPISDDLLLHYWVDISDRKRAEESLIRSERIKALGEMALGMAHNFNNTLQVIVAAARLGLLEAGSANLSEVQNCLQKILSISLVGAGTLKSLIDFGRQSQDSPSVRAKVFDLSKTIAGTVSLCDSYWKAGEEHNTIDVSLELDLADHCLIKGNETEMFEVIMNMIKNSAEALPHGGKIMVTTFAENGRVIVEVSDTGVGIPEDQLAKVFEPFWTTKGFQGTGVGLAACHGIVRRHSGEISVESEVGKGTTFRVALPLADEAGVRKDVGTSDMTDLKLRVLLIDDIPELVSLLQEALALYGHMVFTALSGKEGLQIMFAEHEPLDVVMCDIQMGDMDGWEVAKRVKGYCEKVGLPKPVFFLLTGFGSSVTAGKNIAEWGVDSIVQKPVDILVLLGKVRQIIQRTLPRNRA